MAGETRPKAEGIGVDALAGSAARMEVTVGMDKGFAARPGGPELLRRLAGMGVTSVETYVRWIDFEPADGRFDWSLFDADLDALLSSGLRWVPFLIAGPWYATPDWFRTGPRSAFARCLEHDRETGTQSIWSPHLFPEVARLMAAFAARYGRGDAVESLLLGVTGDYGEAIYTVTGNWPGDYHGHAGYWCGDPAALADFRSWTQRRYGSLAALDAAWGAAPPSWDALRPWPGPARAPSPRAWLDFVQWYRGAMTDWAGRWLREARRVLPATEIYLCTGGDMVPTHGSDFSEQCRVAAAAGAGVRITNEGSDYVQNVMLTRLVASAGRRCGAFFGFEPAAAVNATGVRARQFNATGSGARQLHEYQNNLVRKGAAPGAAPADVPGSTAAWDQGRAWLTRREPRTAVALLHSLPDLALREAGILGGALALARALRPACDFEVLDDHLVADGALQDVAVVFLSPARWWAPDTAERLAAFVAAGGICVASGIRPAALGGEDHLGPLFGFAADSEEWTGISAVHAVEGAPVPAYARMPAQHLARSYGRLDPAVVPLLRLAHTPHDGRPPLVLWYRPEGRGAAVFYAGSFAAGDDWMTVRGAGETLIRDLLGPLPEALGLAPVAVADTAVYETPDAHGVLGWNATDGAVLWRSAELGPGDVGYRLG